MLKNYFKIAWRRLVKSKLYSLINVIGLTTGITACILIGLYVHHELSYDRFHVNADRIARVTMEYGESEGSPEETALTGTKVGPQFQRTFPQIKSFVRLFNYPMVVTAGDIMLDEKKFLFADSTFFSMFSFKLLRGNPATVLDAPNKIVLTQSMAKKYFGNQDPVGKTVKVGTTALYTVTGITEDVPTNSQIDFNCIASFSSTNASKKEQWNSANYFTYLLLQQPGDIAPLQKEITAYMRQINKTEMQAEDGSYLTFHLEALKSVHLQSKLSGLTPNASMTTIYVISVVAMLILLIACINYTNLSAVQAAGRSTEIGLRKTFGAAKKQLQGQFIGESLLLSFIALVLSIVLVIILLPAFSKLADRTITAEVLTQPLVIGGLLLITVITGFASGAYPAFILSNAKLIGILKSGMRLTSSGGGFRKTLIVFQFVISIILIICTLVVTSQLSFVRHKDLGYNKEHILMLPVDWQMKKNYQDLKASLALLPSIQGVSGSYESPTSVGWGDGIRVNTDGKKVSLNVAAMPVDPDFIKTMGMQLVAGTDFTPSDLLLLDTSNDYKNYHNTFILNETAVKAIGWTPEQAIGKTIYKGGIGTIKAVVKDFHFRTLHERISPMVLFVNEDQISQLFVKVGGNNLPGTLKTMQQWWQQRAPHRPFEYEFLDDNYNSLYSSEQRASGLFSVFATIAIILACLGLLGLTAYATVQRTKEIGIRKVLGASVTNITALISKDFVILVGIAILIASPIAWWAMNKWLQDFEYRIHISWWMFAIAGVTALLIAVVTVSTQAIKAAMANPVKSLKAE